MKIQEILKAKKEKRAKLKAKLLKEKVDLTEKLK